MKKQNIVEQAGNVDWDKIEKKSNKKNQQEKSAQEYDSESIAKEVKLLSDDEKGSAYPDEFLADLNDFNKSIGNFRESEFNEDADPEEKDGKTNKQQEEK